MIKGILLGLTLSVIVGPIFFILLQVTIERGVKTGFLFITGVWLSDFLYMIAAFYGIAGIQTLGGSADFQLWMGWIGGLLLLSFGIANLLKPKGLPQNIDNQKITKDKWQLWLKGFVVNSANPGTILFWIGPAGTSVTDAQIHPIQAWIFLISLFLTIVITDLFKIFFAKRLRKDMTPSAMLKMRQISGVALILFGLFLIFKAF
jgi:threonine/homoserine/homoserine lactone efflux protein